MRYWQRGSLNRKMVRTGLVNAETGGDDGGDDGGAGGGAGGGSENWQDTLPENVRSWDEVTNSDSSEKFWDQMSNMRSRMGQSIRIPGDDAGKEAMEEFYKRLNDKVPGLMKAPDPENDDDLGAVYSRLGRPEKAEEYAIPEIKDANGNVIPAEKLDMSLAEAFKEIAHTKGLSQKQYGGIIEAITSMNITKNMEAAEKRQADQESLKSEWGAAHERNSEIVSNFLEKSGAPEMVMQALSKGLMDSKSMKWFHALATETLGDGKRFISDENRNKGVMTPDEAAIKISEIRNNKEHPYHKKDDPGHKAAMKYMRQLYLLKNPQGGSQPAPGTVFNVGGVN
ncbi:MAG: hypothetical protein ACPKM1_15645 [Spirochaetaceae bacterium]